MRQNTPTKNRHGVWITRQLRPSVVDPWSVTDKDTNEYPSRSGAYDTERLHSDCTFTDAGVPCAHDLVVCAWGPRVAWSRVPLAVRKAIIADHPEWAGTVWTV